MFFPSTKFTPLLEPGFKSVLQTNLNRILSQKTRFLTHSRRVWHRAETSFPIGKLYGCGLLCCLLILTPMFSARAGIVDGSHIMDQPMAENLCALTFDDGPAPTTPRLLDMLADYGIPATFFLLGKNAAYFPEIVHRMVAEGHEVGNHTWSHPNLKRMSTDSQARQIRETDTVLRSFGASPVYMRPPYGAFDERTVKIAEDMGLSVILWSMDSYDWKRLPENYAQIVSTRGTVYEPGTLRGIFLFHDIHKTTVDDLPKIVAQLKAGGCQRFVTVSEYLGGIIDPEPPLLMSRHESPKKHAGAEKLRYAAGSGAIPLARCSRPFDMDSATLRLAHADRGDSADTETAVSPSGDSL